MQRQGCIKASLPLPHRDTCLSLVQATRAVHEDAASPSFLLPRRQKLLERRQMRARAWTRAVLPGARHVVMQAWPVRGARSEWAVGEEGGRGRRTPVPRWRCLTHPL